MTRKLSLKKDVLQELTTDELRGVAGGHPTWFSCLDYISCNPLDCVTGYTFICPE